MAIAKWLTMDQQNGIKQNAMKTVAQKKIVQRTMGRHVLVHSAQYDNVPGPVLSFYIEWQWLPPNNDDTCHPTNG